MDSMHNFSMLKHDLGDTNEKFEYYTNIIMFLLGELKTLRKAMCSACRQKWAASSATASTDQSSMSSNDPTLSVHSLKHVGDHDTPTSPQMPEMNAFTQTPTSGSSHVPITASNSDSLVEISTELDNESSNPTFFAQRDEPDTVVDVTFVHSFRHARPISCVRFSHDGRYLAVATMVSGSYNDDSSIVIYEVESRNKYCELREYASQYGSHKRPAIWALFFSSDGRHLAVADVAARIIIWDVPNKRIRCMYHGSKKYTEVLFSPDGCLVAFHTDTELVVLNMRDNSRKMASEGIYFGCLDFSPGGRYIAVGNDGGSPVILEARTGRAVKRWDGHGRNIWHLKFTSDGRGLLCAYNNVIEHWDVNDAEPVLIRKFDHQFDMYYVATTISPDHRLLAARNELRDLNGGGRQYTLEGHNGYISSVDFSAPGAYLAMGSHDHFVSLWKCS